jgi:glycerol-3-phosphate acyltransferase PlsX
MKIAVDAMGGDFGPKVIIPGAAQAVTDLKVKILLVGLESQIRRELDASRVGPKGIEIIDAPEAIGMGEGLLSFRKKKASSIRVGVRLVKSGDADAFVSMGNTGAVVFIAKAVLGAIRGVDRPGLALLVPSVKGPTLLIDVGANANCRPHNLVQFAVMGKIFMETALGVPEPRIGLMSIGEEKGKGNDLVKETFDRLQRAPLRFIGNIEGKDLFSGNADVVVSDGFTGNIALKVMEGVVESTISMARHEVTKNVLAKLGYLLLRRHLKKIYKRVDYSEYGGAHLLGINGVCVVGHGRSNIAAVRSAIRMGREIVTSGIQDRIREEVLRAGHAFEGAAG